MMRFLFCFVCFLAATLTTDYSRHADFRCILALFPKHSARIILNFLNVASFICLLTYICEGRAFLIQFIVVLIHCCYSRNLVEFCEGFVWQLGIQLEEPVCGSVAMQCSYSLVSFAIQ